MACRGNLSAAIRHAELVEATEACAPPVTATYLQAAYDRMRLPIKVVYHHELSFFFVAHGLLTVGKRTPAEATAAYLARAETLTQPTPISTDSLPATASPDAVPPCEQEPGTAGVGTASTSAFSSPSAPPVSPDPGAVAAEIAPANPISAAPNSSVSR